MVLIPDIASIFVLYNFICVALVTPTKYKLSSIRGDMEVFEFLL